MKFKDNKIYKLLLQRQPKIANKLSEANIDQTYISETNLIWPGKHKNIIYWVELKTICIGINENNDIHFYKIKPNKNIHVILKEMCNNDDYKKLTKWEDINQFESYYLIGELLNPSHSYDYTKIGNSTFTFKDRNDIEYLLKLVYYSKNEEYVLEFKLGWLDDNGKIHYKKNHNLENIDSFRSDTIAKVWRDEILPLFKKQKLTNILVFNPLNNDIKRYLFSLKMVQKFKKKWFDIIENKPKQIRLIKK